MTGATKSSYTFSFQMTFDIYQYIYCGGFGDNVWNTVWAQTKTFFAIWDDSTQSTTYSNVYFAPSQFYLTDGKACSGEVQSYWPPYSAENTYCGLALTFSYPVSLTVGHSYSPRVGVYTETDQNAWGATNYDAINDLWNTGYCGSSVQNGVTLDWMDFHRS